MITDTRRTHLRRQEFLQAAAERLQQEWREGHHIKSCPVFFNITNFHLYNAAHGFRQGDLCLQHIENILQEVFPCQPVLHLGSDNFAVLAEAMDVQSRIDTACQRVLVFIGNPNIALKAGIRFLTGLPSTKDLNVAFDSEAKIACASTTAPTATSRSSIPRPKRWKRLSRSCRRSRASSPSCCATAT